MCPPSSGSLSRRGLLTAAALGAAGRGAATTTSETTTTTGGSAPETRWSVNEENAELVYPPTVDGGLAHAVVRFQTDGGFENRSEGAEMRAFDLDSGETKWKKALGGFGAFHERGGDRVYAVGTVRDDDQTTATLYALDADSGSVEWVKSAERFAGVPTFVDGTLYVARSRALVAYDAATGEELWTFDGPAGVRASNMGSPLVYTDRAVFVGERGSGNVYAVDRNDGTELWLAEPEHFDGPPVATDGERVYVWEEGGGGVAALDAGDGSVEWTLTVDGESYWYPGRLHKGTMYVWGTALHAIDVADGTERWRFELDDATQEQNVGYRPQVANGTVYAPTRLGTIYALDPSDGSEQWSFETKRRMNVLWGEVAGGTVYAPGGGYLYALDADDGDRRWRYTVGGPWESDDTTDPAQEERPESRPDVVWTEVTGETILLGTDEGGIYALERNRPFLAATVDDATDFLSSGTGMALAGVVGGAGVLAAYRRLDAGGSDDDPAAVGEPSPEPEFGTLERVRAGPMTDTYRVRERTEDGPRLVAETRLTDPEHAESFLAAVERWAAMADRPGVVPVLEYGEDPEPWVRTPYFERSLADADDLSVAERVDAVSAANAAVHRAHGDGVVHGGVDPSTVLFDDPTAAAVSDWELAAALDRPSPYAAPEEDADDPDEKTDQYRLGATAYHAVTGEPPALDEDLTPPSRVDPTLPEELDDVLATATAADPDDRYDSVVKFDDMLRWAAFRA
ncbi:outer membrane protein assembly factor BamB family protein [Halomicrococcus gelatinilyticus]|uniref:outer membrane protein assembly factor BamB family protein n=1 Tax=Halomicrococcus gelatinilyticus TaxID=1702103 RepID=UPI002E14A2AC